jgi:hypothetical protein
MGEQFPAVLLNCDVQCEASCFHVFFLVPHFAPLEATLQSSAISLLSFGLVDELVDVLLVALSCSSSPSTTARLIGDVRVSVLKMFHPPSDTADTQADISIHHEVARRRLLPSFPLSQEIQ